jgi:hypothetical protein
LLQRLLGILHSGFDGVQLHAQAHRPSVHQAQSRPGADHWLWKVCQPAQYRGYFSSPPQSFLGSRLDEPGRFVKIATCQDMRNRFGRQALAFVPLGGAAVQLRDLAGLGFL